MKLNPIHVQSKVHSLQLDADVTGNTLIVQGGTIRLGGAEYAIEPTEYTFTPNATYQIDLTGYVVSPSEGVATLFVDEVLIDGLDSSYVFDGDEPFEVLDTLFTANIPAGSTLESSQIRYIEISYVAPPKGAGL
jgi:hypothetical protein